MSCMLQQVQALKVEVEIEGRDCELHCTCFPHTYLISTTRILRTVQEYVDQGTVPPLVQADATVVVAPA